MSASLVPIASYPKSGNTWIRIFLERLKYGPDHPINSIDGGLQGMFRRQVFDALVPVNAADLLSDEIEFFLPDVYRRFAAELKGDAFVKVHDTARRNRQGEWLYPTDSVRLVIYVVRHPFDVAVSMAWHFGSTPERAVDFMVRVEPERRISKATDEMPEDFGSWSSNVVSWLDGPYAICLVRYEDLLATPMEQFSRIAAAAGLRATTDELSVVVEAARFERLQREEMRTGFVERAKNSARFFRSGRAKCWEGELDQAMRARIVAEHGAVMERLGYTADGDTLPMPVQV
jgi:aryl sulfotransferase